MNEASFAIEIQQVFLAEAQEMLDATEAAFIQIERNPDDSCTIDRIFRLVHTIKGSGYVAGFAQLGNFAHAFETLLSLIRDKKIAINPLMVDLLLAGNDCLRQFVKELKENIHAQVDTSQLTQRIKAATLLMTPTVALTPTKTFEEPKPPVPQATFLICDDDLDILDVIEEILKSAQYRVVAVKSAVLALNILATQTIDVIITDLKMPELTGIEFARAVRKRNRFIPIVFVSGCTSRDDFKEFLELGVDCFIEKPFQAKELLAVSSRVLREKALRDGVIALSKLSFRAYVAIQKIMAIQTNQDILAEINLEKNNLDACMNEIREATKALLISEKKVAS